MSAALAFAQLILLLAYPLVVYLALGVASPRVIALCTLALVALRLWLVAPQRLAAYARIGVPAGGALLAALAVSALVDRPEALLLAPTAISLGLFASFAVSLFEREAVIERIALAQMGTLSAEEHRYCRRVTGVWCAFFLANATVSAALALRGDPGAWALYTGLIAYVALAALGVTEYLYRHWRFRRYAGALTDPILRRIFPPRGE
jgi:uncharacterized membrane protein